MPLENKIHKNNMNVSIHWVLIHDKINRKENYFSQYSQFSQSGWFVVNKSIIHH